MRPEVARRHAHTRARESRCRPGAALAAVLLDLLAGEPPSAVHPTVAMGRWIAAARRRRRGESTLGDFGAGLATVISGAVATVLVVLAVKTVAHAVLRPKTRVAASDDITRATRFGRALVEGALLKPSLSLRGLLHAGAAVEYALRDGDLVEARRLLAWHLVSRDTSTLDAGEVAGAAIASLAENLSDGLIAPLLAYAAGGLPASYLYRFVNTADAMLGYHTAELEWFGKCTARADDLLNLAPARITALLIALAAPVGRGTFSDAIAIARRDRALTPSPNAGWPMAAAAGALGVRLAKRDAYVLHPSGRVPTAHDIARVRRIVTAAAACAVAIVETIVLVRSPLTRKGAALPARRTRVCVSW